MLDHPNRGILTFAFSSVAKLIKFVQVVPSEARLKNEMRSSEAELISSLGNWVGNRKKVDKKKRYDDDDGYDLFCPPLFVLQILRKVSVFEENLRILKHNFYFLRKRKISGFCYFL